MKTYYKFNLTSDGRFTYTWNAENRLIKAETRDDLPLDVPRYRIEYAYDHQGRMVSKDIFDISKNYKLHMGQLEHHRRDRHPPSSLLPATSFYVWGLDLSSTPQGAGGVGGLLAVIREDGTFAPCYDANGNVTEYVSLTTDHYPLTTMGNVVAHYEYDPFGNTTAQTGPLADTFSFRFSTKYWEAETGILHYQRRPYSPSLGDWLSRDPIEEYGGINLYGFCNNNSVNNYDVHGLFIDELSDFIKALINETIQQYKAYKELIRGYLQMRDANIIGADKWFHCMAMCKASREHAGVALGAGIAREGFDLGKRAVLNAAAHLLRNEVEIMLFEQFLDSLEDMVANLTGIFCPLNQTCQCCCRPYLVRGLNPGDWFTERE